MTYILLAISGAEARIITPSLYITPTHHPQSNMPMQSLVCYDKHDVRQGVTFLLKKYPGSHVLIAQVRFQGSVVTDPVVQYQELSADGDLIPAKSVDL